MVRHRPFRPFLFTLLALSACNDKPADTATPTVDADGDGWFSDEDCDDTDPEVHPGATERCDDKDSDCDGSLDDAESSDARTWYTDADGDGYGDPYAPINACFLPAGYVSNSADCDDEDAGVRPGADELCDGVDNDCDSVVDEVSADSGTWYQDADADGFGDPDTATTACDPAGSFVSDGTDCDDEDPTTWPGAPLGCDGDDHDCDGAVDNDGDGDGYPDEACGGDDCDDTDASRYPTAPEVCGDGVVNDCLDSEAGALATCLGSMDLADADAKLVGEREFDNAGRAVSGAGDMNGDGLADILVGAPQYDLGDEDEELNVGAAYLLLAPLSGTINLSTAHAKLTGEAGGDFAGMSLAGLGDMDNDGFGDLVVGAYHENTGGSDAGAAYVVFGPISGESSLSGADAKLTGGSAGAWAGYSVSSAADFDGDGFGDLLVGAPHDSNGGRRSAGEAYLVLGPISGTSPLSSADGVFLAESADDCAGTDVSGAGDVNGDGLGDVLIGAFGHDNGEWNHGAAYLLLGVARGEIPGLSLSSPDARLLGEAPQDYAGRSVSGAGDTNGDGLNDIIIGADGHGYGGAAYLLLGPVTGEHNLSVSDAKLVGIASSDGVGYSVSGVGDANGDGLTDVLIGADHTENTYLVFGPVSGTLDLARADADFVSETAHSETTVSGAGDVDGDGWDDLLIGEPYESSFEWYAGAAYLVKLGDKY